MGLVSLTAIANGQDADATVVDSNFDAIAAELNGGLENVNIDAAAGITAGKLLPCRTATTVAGIGGSSGDGAFAQLRLASGLEFLALVYDSTSGHWISPAEKILTDASGNATGTTNTRGSEAIIPYFKEKYDAGLTPEFYVAGIFAIAAGGQTLTLQMAAYDHADGEVEHAAGGLVIPATTLLTHADTTPLIYQHSGWVQPTVTAANLGKAHVNWFLLSAISPYTATVSWSAQAWMRWVSR